MAKAGGTSRTGKRGREVFHPGATWREQEERKRRRRVPPITPDTVPEEWAEHIANRAGLNAPDLYDAVARAHAVRQLYAKLWARSESKRLKREWKVKVERWAQVERKLEVALLTIKRTQKFGR